MIFEIVTATLLSCSEAQRIVSHIDYGHYSREEYTELVETVKRSADKNCHVIGNAQN